MSASQNPLDSERAEGGSAPYRLEWIQEETEGITPQNPDWSAYSCAVVTPWDAEPDASTEAVRGIGHAYPLTYLNGAESTEATFTYYLNQWFVDSNGNTKDPSYDAMVRSPDNAIKATHSIVGRETHVTGGTAGFGRHIYTVARGAHPSPVTVPMETEDGTPIELELGYVIEKVRKYSVSQPDSGGDTLSVKSSNAADTTQNITLENEGASTTETLTLNGTTAVSTTNPFDSLDALALDSETKGTVTIEDSSGNVLCDDITGTNGYSHNEGDLGVPALGTGSHATPLVEDDLISFNGDTVEYEGNVPIAAEFVSGELEVDQGLDTSTRLGHATKNVHPTEGEISLSSTVVGPDITVDTFSYYFQEKELDVIWTADEGTVTLKEGHMTTPGSDSPEQGQAKKQVEPEFGFTGIQVQ